MKLSFRGGVHPPQNKNTAGCAIEIMPPPQKVHIPLSQHIGGTCTPLVKKGDKVDKGQIIGNVESGLGCPVHASVSGVVESIDVKTNAAGVKIGQIVIANDFLQFLTGVLLSFFFALFFVAEAFAFFSTTFVSDTS